MSGLVLKLSSRANGALTTLFTSSRYLFTSTVLYKDDKESSDKSAEEKCRKKEVQNKMKELLLKMTKNVVELPESVSKIEIPTPRVKAKQRYRQQLKTREKTDEKMEKQDLAHRLEHAAQKVAESLGGDTKKTEIELLDLFLTPSKSNDDEKKLPDLLATMKIEKEKSREQLQRAHQVRSMVSAIPIDLASRVRSKRTNRQRERVDIFGESPFNIFDKDKDINPTPPVLETWDYLNERDLRLSTTHPPANIFEQLIMWTEQGKIWKFPINNEQDWPENENVDFTEHVFLERHIEPWCPKIGPIRTFMELVCVGLSKNPYLTVDEKKAHITFFEHYFRQKNSILEDAGLGRIPERSEQETVTY